MIEHVGRAPLDLGGPCIFKCGDPDDMTMFQVEMNVDAEGNFHATQDHLNHAERKQGMAHRACYKAWYEKTYGVPFTMSAEDGT